MAYCVDCIRSTNAGNILSNTEYYCSEGHGPFHSECCADHLTNDHPGSADSPETITRVKGAG